MRWVIRYSHIDQKRNNCKRSVTYFKNNLNILSQNDIRSFKRNSPFGKIVGPFPYFLRTAVTFCLSFMTLRHDINWLHSSPPLYLSHQLFSTNAYKSSDLPEDFLSLYKRVKVWYSFFLIKTSYRNSKQLWLKV